jgi:hypothetical protein
VDRGKLVARPSWQRRSRARTWSAGPPLPGRYVSDQELAAPLQSFADRTTEGWNSFMCKFERTVNLIANGHHWQARPLTEGSCRPRGTMRFIKSVLVAKVSFPSLLNAYLVSNLRNQN